MPARRNGPTTAPSVGLYNGVQVDAEVDRLMELPCVKRRRAAMRAEMDVIRRSPEFARGEGRGLSGYGLASWRPVVKLRRRSSQGVSGWAYTGDRCISLTLGEATAERTMELVAHELAHLLTPRDDHGLPFVAMLADMIRERHGVDVPLSFADDRGDEANGAYAWDEVAVWAMEHEAARAR